MLMDQLTTDQGLRTDGGGVEYYISSAYRVQQSY